MVYKIIFSVNIIIVLIIALRLESKRNMPGFWMFILGALFGFWMSLILAFISPSRTQKRLSRGNIAVGIILVVLGILGGIGVGYRLFFLNTEYTAINISSFIFSVSLIPLGIYIAYPNSLRHEFDLT